MTQLAVGLVVFWVVGTLVIALSRCGHSLVYPTKGEGDDYCFICRGCKRVQRRASNGTWYWSKYPVTDKRYKEEKPQ